MSSAIKKIDVPENFFDEEEVPSKEMQALMQDQNAKAERRQKRKSRKPSMSTSSFERTKQEAKQMLEDDEWDKCEARHMIALYEEVHLLCYSVADASLDSQSRYKAVRTADCFVKREFSGNFAKAMAYFRWLWQRESGREKWRRENSREGGHLSWYAVFSGKLLTEYRLYLARKRK